MMVQHIFGLIQQMLCKLRLWNIVRVTASGIGRVTVWAIVLTTMTVVLSLTGCSAQNFTLPEKTDLESADINPHPRDSIRSGGDLHLLMASWPTNFMFYQFDAASVELALVDSMIRPVPFFLDAQGKYYFRTEYFIDITEVIHGKNQIITYTINPAARWSNGEPLSWQDFRAIWQASNGKDFRYLAGDTHGYNQIIDIHPGVDARQAVVTFSPPYSGWKDLFNHFVPASSVNTPGKFNSGWIDAVPPTAGPFKITAIDKITQNMILERDPQWWGSAAKLDRIILRTYNASDGIAPYLAQETDAIEVLTNAAALRQASTTANTAIRRSLSSMWAHLDFNGAPGRITADVRVRRAIAQGIDRQFIQRLVYKITAPQRTQLLNNHFYMQGQAGYQDNSNGFRYDPLAASRALDALGWKMSPDGIRHKDGKSMTLQYLTIAGHGGTGAAIDQLIQHNLADLGIRLILRAVPQNQFFSDYIFPGNYDLTNFMWSSAGNPVTGSESIFYLDFRCRIDSPEYDNKKCQVAQNFGLVGDASINGDYDKILGITDPKDFIRAANAIDAKLWDVMGVLPLYQLIDCIVVRANLANYGLQLLGSPKWEDVGWLQ